MMLFPFAEYWWFYASFIVFVLFVLALDLGVLNRKPHAIGFKEAAGWSVFWISLALLFNLGLWQYSVHQHGVEAGNRLGLEFFTGYVIEKALSVDNIFVIAMILGYFAIPAQYQHRVLFYGIIGALVFRAIFIAIGASLMQYGWVVALAGAFLILTGIKMLLAGDAPKDPGKNPALRLLKRCLPVTQDHADGKFLVRRDGVYEAMAPYPAEAPASSAALANQRARS